LPSEPCVHCFLVLRQTRQVRVDGVDGEPGKGVVGGRLLHLANRSQPASLLLDSSKVESGFNKVDAEDKGRSGMDKRLRLLLVLFITGFREETKNGFLC